MIPILDLFITVVRVIFAIIVILFLPGFLLVNALFPKKRELDEKDPWLVRLVFSVVLSIAAFIAVGFFLNSLGVNSDTGLGYFSTPYILLCLGVLCVVFLGLGIWRGAYPFIYDPLKARTGVKVGGKEKDNMERLREVRLEIADLKRRLSVPLKDKEKERLEEKLEKLQTEREKILTELRGGPDKKKRRP